MDTLLGSLRNGQKHAARTPHGTPVQRAFIRAALGLPFALMLLLMADAARAEPLTEKQSQCAQHVTALKSEMDAVRTRETWLAVIAAVVGAGGSIGALVSEARAKQVAAVLGIVGAVLGGLNQALPKNDNYVTRFRNAAVNQRLGEQVLAQLLAGDRTEKNGVNYTLARFTDCSMEEPSADPPNPPGPYSRAAEETKQ